MLKFGTSVFVNRRKNGSYLSTDGFTNPMFYARIANPYLTPYDKDGNYVYDSDIQNGNSDLLFNTFEERQNTSNETTINSLSSIFDVELRFDDRFKITSQVGLQLDKTRANRLPISSLLPCDWNTKTIAITVRLSFLRKEGFIRLTKIQTLR